MYFYIFHGKREERFKRGGEQRRGASASSSFSGKKRGKGKKGRGNSKKRREEGAVKAIAPNCFSSFLRRGKGEGKEKKKGGRKE